MTEKSSPAKAADNGEFRKWLWDSDRKAFLGRTGANWVQLLVFYTVFYSCLAAFWTLAMVIFMQTIDFKEPKWQQDDSRIGQYPGLGYRPHPPQAESSLISFKQSGNEINHYVEELSKFIKPYIQESGNAIGQGETVASASECESPGYQPPKGKFCAFNYKKAFEGEQVCTEANKFGYDRGQPCVLIKLNKIYGWKPKPYDPASRPEAMKKYVDNIDSLPPGIVVECHGEHTNDNETIGARRYVNQVIKVNHYPYENQQGYQPPFVMVQFQNLARGVVVAIECRAWAENIRHNKKEGEGSVRFEIRVE